MNKIVAINQIQQINKDPNNHVIDMILISKYLLNENLKNIRKQIFLKQENFADYLQKLKKLEKVDLVMFIRQLIEQKILVMQLKEFFFGYLWMKKQKIINYLEKSIY